MKLLTFKYTVGSRVKIEMANGYKLATVLEIENNRVKVSIPMGGIKLHEWITIR